jgi:hypothetical protein
VLSESAPMAKAIRPFASRFSGLLEKLIVTLATVCLALAVSLFDLTPGAAPILSFDVLSELERPTTGNAVMAHPAPLGSELVDWEPVASDLTFSLDCITILLLSATLLSQSSHHSRSTYLEYARHLRAPPRCFLA